MWFTKEKMKYKLYCVFPFVLQCHFGIFNGYIKKLNHQPIIKPNYLSTKIQVLMFD